MDATKTTDASTTNTDAQANANVAHAEGAGTGTADTSQADGSTTVTTNKAADPKVANALKALEDAGVAVFTERQVNGREAALRKKYEAEAQEKQAKAQQEAEAKALAEQGQFKPLYEQEQAARKEAEARMASVEPTLVGFVDAATKEWPKVLQDKRPTEGGYTALQAWYEAYKDIAAEMLKQTTQGKAQAYGQQLAGTGKSTQSTGNGHTGEMTIEPYVSRRQA